METAEVNKPDLADVWPLSPLQEGLLFHAQYRRARPGCIPGAARARAGRAAGPAGTARRPGGRCWNAIPNLRACFRQPHPGGTVR